MRTGLDQVKLTTRRRAELLPRLGADRVSPDRTISITGPESSGPGAVSAAIDDIPLDAIRGETGSTSATPLGGIPLGGIPLGGIPLGGIPLGGIPLGGIGFTAQNLNQNGLGGVPLSTIPLVLPDKWETRLALDPAFTGTPPQNVTLAQVLGTPVVTESPRSPSTISTSRRARSAASRSAGSRSAASRSAASRSPGLARHLINGAPT